MSEKIDKVCIYHKNCADGFTGAWVVKKAHPEEEIEFFGGSYGKEYPHVAGKDVILVDFSYKRDEMIAISKVANTILILDHHKSALEDLEDLQEVCECPVTVVFRMDKSGCRIAWDYYFPTAFPPKMLLHVEDRDLWKFEMEDTKAITMLIFSFSYTFDNWDFLMEDIDLDIAFTQGEAILRKHMKDIVETAPGVTMFMDILHYKNIPVANVPGMWASDMGHHLCQEYSSAPFSVTYYINKNRETKVSFRSDNKADVAKLAEQFGGGGHKNAAGCKIDDLYELRG